MPRNHGYKETPELRRFFKNRNYATTTDARNRHKEWTEKEIETILAEDRPTDRELSAQIGRSMRAIQIKRSKITKETSCMTDQTELTFEEKTAASRNHINSGEWVMIALIDGQRPLVGQMVKIDSDHGTVVILERGKDYTTTVARAHIAWKRKLDSPPRSASQIVSMREMK